MIRIGAQLGTNGPGGFDLGNFIVLGGTKLQLGNCRVRRINVQHTQLGVSNIVPFITPQRHQFGKCRVAHLNIKRTQFGRMNIASAGSITTEIVIQNVGYTPPPTTGQSEITLDLPGSGSAIGGSTKFHVVQSAQSVRNVTSLAFPSNVTSGNLLIALLGVAAGMTNPPPMNDTLGNTWTQAIYSSISGQALSFMWTVTSSSGANTITVTDATFGANSSQIIIAEVNGNIIPVVDTVGNAAGGQPTISVSTAGDVVFGALMGFGGVNPTVNTGYRGEKIIQAIPSVGFDYEIALSYNTGICGSYFSIMDAGSAQSGNWVNYIAVAFQQGYKYAIADNNALGGNERGTYGYYQRLKKGTLIGQTIYRQLSFALTPGYFLPTFGAAEWFIVQENLNLLTATNDTYNASCVPRSDMIFPYGNTSYFGTSTASTVYNGNYDSWIAFTYGQILWGWLNNGSAVPQWLQYQFTAQHTISTYRITPWSVDTFPSRSPASWVFQGSNDGSSWTTLDTQTSFTSNWIINTPTIFTISSPQPFYYYRLYITANGGDTYTAIKTLSMHVEGGFALSRSVGAYRRHRNIVLNDTVGAYNHVQTAEYTIAAAAGVTLPVIGTGYALGQALSQLFHKRHLNVSKFLPVDTSSYTKFHLFPSTYNAWPAMSSFSGTLAGETYNSTSLMVYDAKATQAVRLAPGGVVPGGFECDGVTNVAFNPSQVSTGDWTATCATSVSITPNATVPNGWECDGQTTLAFTVEYDAYGSIECDGATDVQILSIGGFGWEGDGSTDVEFTTIRQVYGYFNMDGSTDCQITNTASNWAGYPNMDGKTNMSITAAQIYSFGNTFTMDGLTSVSITANQAYGFGIQVNVDGSSSCQFITVQRSAVIGFEADGMTAVQFGSVADYFININMDGSTAVTINGAYYPIVQIVCTGVGDSFINALIGHFASLNMDGMTTPTIAGILSATGFLQWFTGIQTGVSFGSAKNVSAFIHCDGATAVNFNPNQDQFGEVVFDQMDQELYALGSFVYTDGQLNAVGSSSITPTSTYYPLGPDYISGIIRLTKNDTGSPDFVPVFTGSFTLEGKVARSQGEGDLGTMIYKRAVGPSRQTSYFSRRAMRSELSDEFIRFPLFVSEAIDFTQISTSVGFTADGISAVAGHGVVGRDKEEYVTFGVLTNTRMTQEALEILAAGDPHVDLTQVCYEMLFIPNSTERMTQCAAEVLYLANLGAIQAEAVEALSAGDGGSGAINLVVVETMASVHANALMTQTSEEVLATGDPYARISSASLEALVYSQLVSFSNAWIQAVAVETMMAPEGNLVVNAEALEALHNGSGNADINAEALEVMHNGSPHADINTVVLEEINNSTTQALDVQAIAVECLVLFETDYTVAGMVNNPRYHI